MKFLLVEQRRRSTSSLTNWIISYQCSNNWHSESERGGEMSLQRSCISAQSCETTTHQTTSWLSLSDRPWSHCSSLLSGGKLKHYGMLKTDVKILVKVVFILFKLCLNKHLKIINTSTSTRSKNRDPTYIIHII